MPKPPRSPAPGRARKPGRPSGTGSQTRMVTAVVATAFISTVLSAAGVLLIQRAIVPETSGPANGIADQKIAPKYENFAYYEFPKISVYLKSSGRRDVGLANIRVTAELTDPESIPVTKTAQARILDAMQAYLRDSTREDLDGRQGTDRLRGVFLTIVNDSITPHRANTVLFREIVIQ